ncbi:MAG: tRNA pseudouridine(13) synthase TruD [Candidatus Woesearchaeota archaeon]
MYILKQLPEDFVVEEIMPLGKPTGGDYAYCSMTKRCLTTFQAAVFLARALKIPQKFVKYSGNKDKDAVTTQTISICKTSEERLGSVAVKNLKLDFLGYFKEPVFIGMHKANRFIITARNIESPPKHLSRFINYFGKQRFSHNNVDVGRSIVKKDFALAASLLSIQGNEKIASHLKAHPNDFVGAIRMVPKSLVKLCVHSFQSHIWNKAAVEISKQTPQTKQLKIVGFATDLEDDDASRVIRSILKVENVSINDFVIRQLPEFSVEGQERDIFSDVSDLKVKGLEDDDLNPGKKKCVLTFTLPKGSYATVLVDQMFGKT